MGRGVQQLGDMVLRRAIDESVVSLWNPGNGPGDCWESEYCEKRFGAKTLGNCKPGEGGLRAEEEGPLKETGLQKGVPRDAGGREVNSRKRLCHTVSDYEEVKQDKDFWL